MLNWIVWNRTVYMYKIDLVLNNLEWLICHKIKTKSLSTIKSFVVFREMIYLHIYLFLLSNPEQHNYNSQVSSYLIQFSFGLHHVWSSDSVKIYQIRSFIYKSIFLNYFISINIIYLGTTFYLVYILLSSRFRIYLSLYLSMISVSLKLSRQLLSK